jgi:hypothetical protein
LATEAETLQATDTTRAVTPAGLNKSPSSVKAWVNFNGSTLSIQDSYNVSSLIDNGPGDYIINFLANVFQNNYYVIYGTLGSNGGNASTQFNIATPGPYTQIKGNYSIPKLQTSEQVEIYTAGSDGIPTDIGIVHFSAFGK